MFQEAIALIARKQKTLRALTDLSDRMQGLAQQQLAAAAKLHQQAQMLLQEAGEADGGQPTGESESRATRRDFLDESNAEERTIRVLGGLFNDAGRMAGQTTDCSEKLDVEHNALLIRRIMNRSEQISKIASKAARTQQKLECLVARRARSLGR